MNIDLSEFKNNIDKYLELAQREDIFISENGRIIMKLSKAGHVDAISGSLANKGIDNIDKEAIREERLKRYSAD